MNTARYNAELSVLRQKFSSNCYKFVNPTSNDGCLKIVARTNSGNVYTLHVDLCGFPEACPKVFVTKMLHTKSGEDMSGASSSMHTLSSEHGWTRICHYGSCSYTPNVSLYKIYVKCRLWLEMYEAHLRTGKPIDYYLNHQA